MTDGNWGMKLLYHTCTQDCQFYSAYSVSTKSSKERLFAVIVRCKCNDTLKIGFVLYLINTDHRAFSINPLGQEADASEPRY